MTQLSIANYNSRKMDLDRLNASIASSLTNAQYSRPNMTRQVLVERKSFCIFLKILVNNLTKNDLSMRRQVKMLIRECTRKNREGDLKFSDLTQAIQLRLQYLVGERTWQQTHLQTERFLRSNSGKVGAWSLPTTVGSV